MPEATYYPTDAEGNAKALIRVSEENKIGLEKFSNVTIGASISRFVNDSNENVSKELNDAHALLTEFLDSTYIEGRRQLIEEEVK
jgi:hypothetical protein